MSNYLHEPYWPQIKSLAEAGNYNEIETLLSHVKDSTELIALYRFSIRGLMFREWNNKNLKPIIQLGDRAVSIALENDKTDEANIISYNMSANLADCWNDGFERKPEHFEKGLEYAEKALSLRQQLKKGPGLFSIAYWAKGIHLFSLGKLEEAENDFELSLKYAIEDAKSQSQPSDISKNASFSVLLGYGYLALAQIARGQKQAQKIFDQVMVSFEEMKAISEDAKADAEIGLDQLNYVKYKVTHHT